MRTDGRTDMTKLIVAFRNFSNGQVNVKLSLMEGSSYIHQDTTPVHARQESVDSKACLNAAETIRKYLPGIEVCSSNLHHSHYSDRAILALKNISINFKHLGDIWCENLN